MKKFYSDFCHSLVESNKFGEWFKSFIKYGCDLQNKSRLSRPQYPESDDLEALLNIDPHLFYIVDIRVVSWFAALDEKLESRVRFPVWLFAYIYVLKHLGKFCRHLLSSSYRLNSRNSIWKKSLFFSNQLLMQFSLVE